MKQPKHTPHLTDHLNYFIKAMFAVSLKTRQATCGSGFMETACIGIHPGMESSNIILPKVTGAFRFTRSSIRLLLAGKMTFGLEPEVRVYSNTILRTKLCGTTPRKKV